MNGARDGAGALPLADAAAGLVAAFGVDSGTAHDVAPSLTCGELDALCELFAAAGALDLAHAWMAAHAVADEPGDCHAAAADGEPCSHGLQASAGGCS